MFIGHNARKYYTFLLFKDSGFWQVTTGVFFKIQSLVRFRSLALWGLVSNEVQRNMQV